MQSLLLENLVLGKKSNQQTKTNYKPKANDKGKENNAIFFGNLAEFSIKIMN